MISWLVLVGALSGGAAAQEVGALEDLSRSVHGQSPVRIQSELTLELIPLERDTAPVISEPVTAVIDWVSPGNGVFRIGDYDAYISDKAVIITRDGVEDAYLRCRPSLLPAEVLQEVFASCPFPMLAIAFPDESSDRTVDAIHPVMVDLNPVNVTRNDRGQLIEMTWTGDAGDLALEIDPVTGRPVAGVLLQRSGSGIPNDLQVRSRWTWTYEEVPEGDPVSFTRGNRFRVDRLSALKSIGEDAVSEGGMAPELRLPSLEGRVIDLEAFRGRVVVIDFWATWCGPCLKALPKLQRLADEMAEAPVTILSVDCFERTSGQKLRKQVQARVDDLSLTFPVLLDETGEAAQRWGVQGIPATFVIGPDGRIVATHTGAGPEYLDTLREDIEKALAP
ncbi:MAG: TlpA disulfide reductase family protein [Planctomycetota bacterium]|nr:TlpA disulfide reductase family protein [Planctomycetota bacterium]